MNRIFAVNSLERGNPQRVLQRRELHDKWFRCER